MGATKDSLTSYSSTSHYAPSGNSIALLDMVGWGTRLAEENVQSAARWCEFRMNCRIKDWS
jgi:hypothetical protein